MQFYCQNLFAGRSIQPERTIPGLGLGASAPWLAPLAGYSDLPFRLLCRSYGAAVCETEMISAKGLAFKSPGTSDLLASCAQDSPLVVQLFGSEEYYLEKAVDELAARGFCYFDLNMGCPVRKVLRQGAGSALLADRPRAMRIARAMTAAGRGQAKIYVGFKLRLGLDGQSITFEDLGPALEDAGAAWLTLHPRTARDGYGGQARQHLLAHLRRRVSIPVLASGDLLDASAGLDCLARTGADGLMYARGALRDPSIFAAHHDLLAGLTHNGPRDLRKMILEHIRLAREFGPGRNAFYKMRSMIPRYARYQDNVRQLRSEICAAADWAELAEVVEKFFAGEQANGSSAGPHSRLLHGSEPGAKEAG